MKPRLNLATAPLENNRQFFAVALGIGLPALVIFAVLTAAGYRDWHATGQRRAEVTRLRADLSDYEQRRADLEKSFSAPETKVILERAAFLNGLIEQRSFPWTKMFMDLEHEMPEGVHMVSLTPRMQAGVVEVHMVVAATSDRIKLEFLRSLENSAEFKHLVVLSETRPSRQEDPADTVQVEMVAQYSSAEPSGASRETASEKPAAMAVEKAAGKAGAKRQ
jgi:Tfp pilus assembly protein PilN